MLLNSVPTAFPCVTTVATVPFAQPLPCVTHLLVFYDPLLESSLSLPYLLGFRLAICGPHCFADTELTNLRSDFLYRNLTWTAWADKQDSAASQRFSRPSSAAVVDQRSYCGFPRLAANL